MISRVFRYCLVLVAVMTLSLLFVCSARNDFGLGRTMELVVNMMRELTTQYVEPIDSDKLMQGAADGMVEMLDPYTEFIPESEMKSFELMTTGEYGGIGSLIRQKGDWVRIAQPYKGSPADKAGLKIGDKIVSINGKSAEGFTVEDVSSRLKGEAGTSVRLELERLDSTRYKAKIERERIAIPSIPYWGYLSDSVAYIRHTDFTDGCYDAMRSILEPMLSDGHLKGLVLDYRSNGGGVMQEAVKILSMFLPKGTEVVSTKGREASSERSYTTPFEPILPNLPLVVLINGSSASAAEIVAGALQDLDRAVVIGQRSFGKGLVQSPVPIGYNAILKLTTAKYYIPSGRCIQAIDYSHSQSGDVHSVPDSLITEFTTLSGRKVYDGGGVMPDVRLEPQYVSRFAVTLYALGFIEDFVDEYMVKNPNQIVDVKGFSITDADFDDFCRFIATKEVSYESETRRALKILQRAADDDRYTELSKRFKELEAEIEDDTATNLQTYRSEIISSINSNIVLRHHYSEGVVEHSLKDDSEIKCAQELVLEPSRMEEILKHQDTKSR